MSEAGIARFFEIARERYQIMLNRRAGMPKPWSSDSIFQNNYFCNTFREDDKTTQWFRENIRDIVSGDEWLSLISIVLFRWFNKIEIGEILKPYLLKGSFFLDEIKDAILKKYPEGPFVTGAYIIKTPDGMRKLDGVLWCVDQFVQRGVDGKFDKILSCANTLQSSFELLKGSPFLGDFMSNQILSDAVHTCLLKDATDRHSWAKPGPGTTRGLGRTFYNDANHFSYGSGKDQKEMLDKLTILYNLSQDEKYWPSEWPKWDVLTVAHANCEVDKYIRCGEGGRMKRKYNAA